MKYVSTRGGGELIGYKDVILQGLAPDGGLYVPESYPKIDLEFLKNLKDKTYAEIFVAVNSLFVDEEIELETQKQLAEAAYMPEKFMDAKNGNITPVSEVNGRIYLQQLSLGPTAAFKDMAMQPLGQHLNYVLEERDETLRILGATSGDTGSSAEAAMKGLPRVSLTMLSPAEGMSAFQKAQMSMLSGGNIQNLSVTGHFDDCQDMVKALKRTPEFADLGAVNSINWGRVAAQLAYYFSGYVQACGEIGKEIDFVVPSGNFGNVLAGYIAKKMGVPIRRLIVASNENDVMHRLIQTGVYEQQGGAHVTTSPSMDITKASNYERVLPDIFGNKETAKKYMEQFDSTGRVSFEDFGAGIDSMKRLGFDSGASTHADRLESIRWANEYGVVIDPHTADAVTVARQFAEREADDTPLVCMATALPVKFEDTIAEALGSIPARPKRYENLEVEASEIVGFAATLKADDLETLAEWVRKLN